ncbi:protein rep [Streptococcus henryi]|uniref:protein rep n=1 Tax=Streptococcus henryi TaxID=439219 RepID=UPI00037712D4|nr:protein rep [Streptococcus henryi]
MPETNEQAKTAAEVLADLLQHDREAHIRRLFEDDNEGKRANLETAKRYREAKDMELLDVSEKKLARIRKCANLVKYAVNGERDKKALLYTETCKDKFCLICARNKARRDTRELLDVAKAMARLNNVDTVFITLTIVSGHDLGRKIDELNNAYDRLMRREMFTDVSKGAITKLEVTYNEEHGYHPHLHVLMFVGKNYYKKRKGFIEREDLLTAWREVTGDPRITQVDIRRTRANRRKGIADSNEAAALEVGKYVAKASEYNATGEVFAGFVKGLHGRKVLRYSSTAEMFRNAHRVDRYGIFDMLWGDNRSSLNAEDYTDKALLDWNKSAYQLEFHELTAQERELLAKRFKLRDPSKLEDDMRATERKIAYLLNEFGRLTDKTKRRRNSNKRSKLKAKLRGLETLRWVRDRIAEL